MLSASVSNLSAQKLEVSFRLGGQGDHAGVQRLACPRRGATCSAQAVEHYEISRYGTLATWADELGMAEAGELLKTTLGEEEATDKALSEIAEAVVNQEAQGVKLSPIEKLSQDRLRLAFRIPSLRNCFGTNPQLGYWEGGAPVLAKSPRSREWARPAA
jgi:hypothetical protein